MVGGHGQGQAGQASGEGQSLSTVRVETHQASGPAVNHLRQAELELTHELLGRLSDATLPLQLPDPLGHRQHLIDALDIHRKEKEV